MWARLALWAAIILVVAGQNSNVTQCIPTYNWSFNAKGQSPCLVAAYLESACGTPTNIDSIPNGTHYIGPNFAQANDCLCSSVTYSLVSACGGCQGRNYANWTTWTTNCKDTTVASFPKPIPAGTDVPTWANFDITSSGNDFDPTIAARLAGFDISSTAFTTEPAATGGLTVPPPSSISTSNGSPTSTVPAPSASTPASSSHSGAIAGGVVGGLVLLALVLLVLLRWHMKRQRAKTQKDLVFDQGALFSGSSSNHAYAQSPEPLYSNTNNTRSAPFSSQYVCFTLRLPAQC
ncbi:hypothetical protein CPB83DRAFT_438003 [Crepidotus variabilis]|uniref:Uncharacterized protein n=1 Tax=Crepidotus variabilis TaxID=179855 RepID=A0A9P6ECN9_9AGAR|nr:hypothetical protein CPB83DRAFT_438003 [Crepidotus variabilis]